MSSSSSSEPDTGSSTSVSTSTSEESETSDSESTSDSDESSRSLQKAGVRERVEPSVHPYVQFSRQPGVLTSLLHSSTFVPPGYGKPQTRSRNLRRRLRRMHEREASDVSLGGPVSGANAAVAEAGGAPTLLSLSLRNKNKAKNFKSLMGRPLAPKIIFGDQDAPPPPPRLIPPSSRSSLPPNLFVTSVDVEAGLHRGKKMRIKYGDALEGQCEAVPEEISLDYGAAPDAESEVDIHRLEATANEHWATLEKPTREKLEAGMIIGYKVRLSWVRGSTG